MPFYRKFHRWLAVLLPALIFGTFLVWMRPAPPPQFNGKDVPTWCNLLVSSDRQERRNAQEAFLTLGSNSVPQLVKLLRKDQSFLTKAVGRISSYVPGKPGDYLHRISKPVDYTTLHYNAACALTLIGTNASAAVPALAAEIRRAKEPAIWEAGRALGAIGKPAVPELLKLAEHTNNLVRHAAVQAIAKIGPDAREAVPVVIPLLADQHPPVRACALNALSAIGNASAVGLLNALENGAPVDRSSAAEALIGIRAPRAILIPRLLPLCTNSNPELRRESIRIMGALHFFDPEVIRAYSLGLRDQDTTVCIEAAKAIYGVARVARETIPDLIAALEHQDPRVGEWSARALGRMGNTASEALPNLEAISRNSAGPLRSAATQAIAKISQSPDLK